MHDLYVSRITRNVGFLSILAGILSAASFSLAIRYRSQPLEGFGDRQTLPGVIVIVGAAFSVLMSVAGVGLSVRATIQPHAAAFVGIVGLVLNTLLLMAILWFFM